MSITRSRRPRLIAGSTAALAASLCLGTLVGSPASAAGSSSYQIPEYATQFEVVENQCANVLYGDNYHVRCWTENGTDFIMRVEVRAPKLKNVQELRVQKNTAVNATQGEDRPDDGRTYTFLKPAGTLPNGYPYFLFSLEKWGTQSVELVFRPMDIATDTVFNVNRETLDEPVVQRQADAKQGNFWRLSEALHLVSEQKNGETRNITLEATAETPADASHIVGGRFFRVDPATYLYDGAPNPAGPAMANTYVPTDPVECPGTACTLTTDTTTGRIAFTMTIPSSWERFQYIVNVDGQETEHPFRPRRPYQAQIAIPQPTRIDVPATPHVDDPCGVDNARWVKPEDTANYTWELTADQHLVARTVAGVEFTDGKSEKDFGLAPDSGELCPTPTPSATPEVSVTPTPVPSSTPEVTPTPTGDVTPTPDMTTPATSAPTPEITGTPMTPQPSTTMPTPTNLKASTPATPKLARTGTDALLMGAGAILLLGIGGLIVVIAKRRRDRD